MKHPYNRAGVDEGLFLFLRVGGALQKRLSVIVPKNDSHGVDLLFSGLRESAGPQYGTNAVRLFVEDL